MKNTYCLFQIKFITDYTNVQQVIITQNIIKNYLINLIKIWSVFTTEKGLAF